MKTRFPRTALVTIHDVMPETLSQVFDILLFLNKHNVNEFTLLVVPGKVWTSLQIAQLRRIQKMGGHLAGHGWRHQTRCIKTLRHKLHGKIISRNEAEHLSLSENQTAEIINRSYTWFIESGLGKPNLYVPPAWAMGNIGKAGLSDLPYKLYEYQSGVYNRVSNRFHIMPVTGYMADNPFRGPVLKALNFINMGLPLDSARIAIHPEDLNLPLKDDLKNHLKRFRWFSTYPEMINKMESRAYPVSRPISMNDSSGRKNDTI